MFKDIGKMEIEAEKCKEKETFIRAQYKDNFEVSISRGIVTEASGEERQSEQY